MNRVKLAFEKLLKSKTVDDVNKILDDLKIHKKFRMDDEAYPKLEFKITKDEIEELRKKGLISANSISNLPDGETLTKLLYALAWKNADLKKVKHIVEGIISGPEDDKDDALVFYQFGKYLTKRSGEPIIDQHVLRAFGIYKARGDSKTIKQLRLLSSISKKQKQLIEEYKVWLQTKLSATLRANEDYSYHVDKVLFALGKSLKTKKSAKKRA